MKLITRWTNAADAARRWLLQYPDDRDSAAKRIRSLGPNPNPDDVDRIVGNDSWTNTYLRCSECDALAGATVQVGHEPDRESSTAWLCADCISRALKVINDEPTPDSVPRQQPPHPAQ